MPNIQPSPPFSLAPHDYKSLGIGAIFAVVGALCAYATAVVLPTLQSHEANQLGALIVTLLAAFVPWVLNLIKKFSTDTTIAVKLLVMALGLSLASVAGAAELGGVTTGPTGSVITDLLGNLTKDPLLMAAVLIGGSILISKVLKIDLTPFILPIITSLLKPPGPTPTPVPGPVPTPGPLPVPSPIDIGALIQLLVGIITKPNASAEEVEAAKGLLVRITGK